jgi:hypothetical protein
MTDCRHLETVASLRLSVRHKRRVAERETTVAWICQDQETRYFDGTTQPES